MSSLQESMQARRSNPELCSEECHLVNDQTRKEAVKNGGN